MRCLRILYLLLLVTAFPFALYCSDNWPAAPGVFPGIPQYQAINVFGKHVGNSMEDTRIEPFEKIFVSRGARVRWFNLSDTPIKIKFGTGTACKDISRAPQESEQWRTHDTCYITEQPLPTRGSLRVLFNEKDTYNYEVQFVGRNSTLKGQLVVN